MKFASRSAIESASSANPGSSVASGLEESEAGSWVVLLRSDVRDEGRSGVVGLGGAVVGVRG